jgi:hypothetical protein
MTEKFIRSVDGSLVKKIKSEPLWKDFLCDDCKKGEVFLAVRDKAIDFYHKGGRLFRYTSKGFGTDVKYATTLQEKDGANNRDLFKQGLVYASELAKLKPVSDFTKNYKMVKQNCKEHNKDSEASLVSKLYHKYSYLSKSDIIVLDTEIAFSPLQKGKTQDRIDILLFDLRALQFVEAKRFSDSRLYSNSTPEVIGQLERYKKQLQERVPEIQTQYCRYIENLNMIFDMNLPPPQTVETEPILWIFDYNIQEKAKIKEIMTNSQYKGIKVYAAGATKDTLPKSIYEAKAVP